MVAVAYYVVEQLCWLLSLLLLSVFICSNITIRTDHDIFLYAL